MLAVAEMYIKGVSTRDVEAVMREFGIESLSSSQVSRAAKLLDEELEAWRDRPLGEIRYLILDARYEKMRHGGVVRDAAVLSAIGIGPDERRRVLGVSVALSEAEVHWRAFLESLVARGLRGVEFIVSDDHAACAPPAGPCWAAPHGSAASSTSPGTPSITRRASRSASASAPAARDLERSLSRQGRNRLGRARRELPRHCAEAGGMAGDERARRPRRLHPA